MDNFLGYVKKRRSIYALEAKSTMEDAKLEEMLKAVVKEVPSPFNSQSARVILLLGDNSKKLWEIVLATLKEVTPPKNFAATEEKIAAFAAGYGTILFFEETATVKDLQESFPLYKDHFPKWSLQSSGMVQFAVWTALADKGMGASLQHYNPIIDEKVAKEWNLPQSWQLMSQMPFGKIVQGADEKEYMPIEDRFKIFK